MTRALVWSALAHLLVGLCLVGLGSLGPRLRMQLEPRGQVPRWRWYVRGMVLGLFHVITWPLGVVAAYRARPCPKPSLPLQPTEPPTRGLPPGLWFEIGGGGRCELQCLDCGHVEELVGCLHGF